MSSAVDSGTSVSPNVGLDTPSAAAAAGATPAGSVTLASSISQAPSACCPRRRATASTASRVLPTPPGPTSVTNRLERTASLQLFQLDVTTEEAAQRFGQVARHGRHRRRPERSVFVGSKR